ncbi:alpha/beta-hydrolase [Viridothelium virens]|uniref:Putative phospholipase n=1 Tax=Viridothelium virens TaxID=1048519 RepID=A0A6A6H2N0_VIRVR|nr:alpha/beta-hydrolase [Viridothelium virens]
MPILSKALPGYSGRFGVGAVDVEIPAENQKIIGKATFKSNNNAALQLETVLFTLYYPSIKASSHPQHHQRHYWIPRPISLVATGYACFAHISSVLINWIVGLTLWALAGSTKIPAVVDAPIFGSKSFEDSAVDLGADIMKQDWTSKFPIIIFSHGMAGMRTSYSQYCGELASRGYVVAALEHRDGSGPGTVIQRQDAKDRKILHIPYEQVKAKDGGRYLAEDFKTDQKAFRSVEVEETIVILRKLYNGHGLSIAKLNTRDEGATVLADLKNRLDLSNIIIAGHSYGATLAIQTLSSSPNPRLPFKGAIILDPGKRSGKLNEDVKVPTLIVNSGSWSRDPAFFNHVKALTQRIRNKSNGGKAWFLTLLHTAHPSVTDAPLIEPWLLNYATGASLEAQVALKAFVDISDDFVRFVTSRGNGMGLNLKNEIHDPDDPSVIRRTGEGPSLSRQAFKRKGGGPQWAVHVAPLAASQKVLQGND